MPVAAATDEALQHRGLRLLGLQEQRIVGVAPGEQHDPGARAHAADADDLAGESPEPVQVEERLAVVRQAGAVAAQRRLDGVRVLPALGVAEQFLRGHQERRLAAQARDAVLRARESRERAQVVLLDGALQILGEAPGVGAPQRRALLADGLYVQVRVPDLDGPLLRHLEHGLAVLAHRGQHDAAPVGGGEAPVLAGHVEACGQAFDVPLPRPRQGLVEVVDVEDEAALWRLEEAEVHEVRVAADLGA